MSYSSERSDDYGVFWGFSPRTVLRYNSKLLVSVVLGTTITDHPPDTVPKSVLINVIGGDE